MKILLLNEAFYPDVVSTAQHLTDLALDLRKEGHEVTVICSRRGYSDRETLYPATEEYQGIKIIRVSSTRFNRRIIPLRIINSLSFMFLLLVRLFLTPKHDVVVGLTSPPLLAFLGIVYSRIKGARFVYWVMDLNPDEAVEAGILKRNGAITNILEWISRLTFRNSNRIIALDRFMKERIANKGINETKIVCLPPWAHDDDLEPVKRCDNPFVKKHGLEDKFVVMYSGNHSICHPLDTLLNAALQLREKDQVRFLFIGGGIRVADVTSFKEEHNLENIIQLPYQPIEDLKYSLSAADLQVIVMGDRYVGIVHPCKVYGILAVGAPFVCIAPQESHLGDIIDANKLGSLVAHGETEDLLEVIEETMRMNENQREDLIASSGDALRDQFSRTVLSPSMLEVICPD